jgi:nucleotide-binding universal stress UspA family protein
MGAMFSTIIVGVDARPGGRDALALAAQLGEKFGGRLIAVHAYPYDYFISRGTDASFEAVMHGTAQATLDGELEACGIAAQAVATADDSPARALHRIAERDGGDLIVVGSAHRGPVGRVLAGDVTASTLHGAPCPVLIAPRGYAEHGGELRTIGVGFDGSPESRAAVDLARKIAQTAGAQLRVIDVVVPLEPGSPFAGYHIDWAEHERAKRAEAEERLRTLLAELGDLATGDVTLGDPARELAYEAKRLDMLIVGSRGYGPMCRLMFGSTSHKLVHETPCPVVVLTRGAHGADEEEERELPTTAGAA